MLFYRRKEKVIEFLSKSKLYVHNFSLYWWWFWHFHKRIINFCPVACYFVLLIHRAVKVSQFVCLTVWGLTNILNVTLDNTSLNDMNHWDYGLLKWAFLHMRCAAHIFNLVVNDSLNDVSLFVKKVRALVKYTRFFLARLTNFKSCVLELKKLKVIGLNVDIRWNLTFFMLETTLETFFNLLLTDDKKLKKCDGGMIEE